MIGGGKQEETKWRIPSNLKPPLLRLNRKTRGIYILQTFHTEAALADKCIKRNSGTDFDQTRISQLLAVEYFK